MTGITFPGGSKPPKPAVSKNLNGVIFSPSGALKTPSASIKTSMAVTRSSGIPRHRPPVPFIGLSSRNFFPNRINFSSARGCWKNQPFTSRMNRTLETPLAKVRMAGWLFYRFQHAGFLHWGYNYWYKRATTQLINPFFQLDAEAWPIWPAGDPFVVYPGTKGPLDSISPARQRTGVGPRPSKSYGPSRFTFRPE